RKPGEAHLVPVYESCLPCDHGYTIRDAEAGTRPPGLVGHRCEEVAERQVDSAEQVPLARDTPLEREHVAPCDVTDVDDVEARGVDEAPDPAGCDAGDHPPRRGGLPITVADRC